MAFLTTALLTCIVAWPANPAQAADDKGAAQAALSPSPAADQVAGVIGDLALKSYSSSYAGLRVDAATSTVTVYSTDAAAAKELTETALRSISAGTRADVEIVTASAAYSKDELWTARATLWEQKQKLQANGAKLTGIAARFDGQGLTVLLDKQTTTASSRMAASVEAVAEAATGVQVDIDWRAAPAPISRFDDSQPYWGGAYIKYVSIIGWTTSCTSAFGMAIGGTEWLMTADHCFDLNSTIQDGGNDVVGVANRRNTYNDALGIQTNTNRYLWVADQLYARYSAAAWSFAGQTVCHGGYVTSVVEPICLGVTVNDDMEWEMGDGLIRRGVEGFRCSGCVAGDQGDSGGPVFAARADGTVESRGILSAAGEEIDGGFEYVYWTETPRILSAFGATLITTD
jgi:hypothetical protein